MRYDFLPFSTMGSYWAVSPKGLSDLYIRDLRGGDSAYGAVFSVVLPENADIEYLCSPQCLNVCTGGRVILAMTFEDENILRIRTYKEALVLKFLAGPYDDVAFFEDFAEATHYQQAIKIGIHPIESLLTKGLKNKEGIKLTVIGSSETGAEVALESYRTVSRKKPDSSKSFETFVAQQARQYAAFSSQFDTETPYYQQASWALHTLWRNGVQPEGHLKYLAVYMSKNWMNNIWSWDHYFTALGLASGAAQLAYEQLLIFETLQDDSGILPDYVNDKTVSFACTKPPLLGWAYDQLLQLSPEFFGSTERLKRIVQMAERQTQFWINHRMSTFGLPFYTHGNDSGWDNGSHFAEGIPVVSPDLAAFLVRQCLFLSRSFKRLNQKDRADAYEREALALIDKMLIYLWTPEGQFKPLKQPENTVVTAGESLQRLMPLLIAERLPKEVVDAMLADLVQFETPFGLATEAPHSPLYRKNGYWLGPVWAPSSYLITSALDTVSPAISKRLKERFLKAVAVGGMAENFDPFSGEGLVDNGFTWTAAVTLRYISELKAYGGDYDN